MKTKNFLWATLATAILTLTGCSSDDNELTVPQPQDKTALLELRLIGNGINTKATGVKKSHSDVCFHSPMGRQDKMIAIRYSYSYKISFVS
jgi:uncharacterized protein YcfL